MNLRRSGIVCVVSCLLILLPALATAQQEPLTLVVQLGPGTGQNQGLMWHGDGEWHYQFDGQAQLPFGRYLSQETHLPAEGRSLLLFPLEGLPAGAEVLSASLELYVDDWPFAGSGPIGVYPVQAAWSEPLTWAGQPPTAATAVVSRTLESSPGWVAWDVTGLVQSWADGAPNHGLMLAAVPAPDSLIDWAASARGRTDVRDPGLLPRLTVVHRQPPTFTPTPRPTATPSPGPSTVPPVVPEPSSVLLLGSAAASMAGYAALQYRARRRR